jgi:D-sedoheptulose 7-phosphate isomerase
MATSRISDTLATSAQIKNSLAEDKQIIEIIEEIIRICVASLRNGGKIWFCGNGGSAADAQHLAAELSGRFYHNRKAYAAEALHVNSSFLTAVANDFGYNTIYSRALEAHAKSGDVLIALSTSGKSENIAEAIKFANHHGIQTVLLTGQDGGYCASTSNLVVRVPSSDTPRIQEAHITIGHIICGFIESEIM